MRIPKQTVLPDGRTELRMPGWLFKTPYGSVSHSDHNMESEGWIKLCEHEIVAVLPAGFDMIGAEVAALRQQMKVAETNHYVVMQQFESKIADLLCLPAPAPTMEPLDDIPF